MLNGTIKKDICFADVLLFWVSPPEGRLHPSVIQMLGGSEFRLRRGFACGKTLVRRKSAAGQKAGWVAFIVAGLKMKISILTVPSKKERHAFSVSFFFGFAGRCPLYPSVFLTSNGGPPCGRHFPPPKRVSLLLEKKSEFATAPPGSRAGPGGRAADSHASCGG